jgi:hypothetical protein
MNDQKIIVIRERFWESVAKDVVTFITLCTAIGVGVWFNSAVLQTAAVILWCAAVLVWLLRFKKDSRYTLDEAAAIIAEWKQSK